VNFEGTRDTAFGIAVALSGDAKTLFIGANKWEPSDDDDNNYGGVFV
jgi:hypothetical protein